MAGCRERDFSDALCCGHSIILVGSRGSRLFCLEIVIRRDFAKVDVANRRLSLHTRRSRSRLLSATLLPNDLTAAPLSLNRLACVCLLPCTHILFLSNVKHDVGRRGLGERWPVGCLFEMELMRSSPRCGSRFTGQSSPVVEARCLWLWRQSIRVRVIHS